MDAGQTPEAARDERDLFGQLERRIVSLVEDRREATAARRSAEAEVSKLRSALQEREMEVILLKKRIDGDEVQAAVRKRIEALIQRIDELEQGG